MSDDGGMNAITYLHPVAILKGAVEGDPYLHLGSLLGVSGHVETLVRAGLVESSPVDEIIVTPLGVAFYVEHNLTELPDGRANSWPTTTTLVATFDAMSRSVAADSRGEAPPKQQCRTCCGSGVVDVRPLSSDGYHLCGTACPDCDGGDWD